MTGPLKSSSFQVGGKNYEVRVWRDGAQTFVQCYLEDKAIGARFSVTDETNSDIKRTQGVSAIRELVRIAVGDVLTASMDV